MQLGLNVAGCARGALDGRTYASSHDAFLVMVNALGKDAVGMPVGVRTTRAAVFSSVPMNASLAIELCAGSAGLSAQVGDALSRPLRDVMADTCSALSCRASTSTWPRT